MFNKMFHCTAVLLFFALSLPAVSSIPINLYNCKILDLTHVIKKGIPRWPGSDFEFQVKVRGPVTIGTYKHPYIESNSVLLPEHFGTHVDGPSHFYPWPDMRIDSIPLQNGMGPACVFDISEKAKTDKDYGLTVEDIDAWEAANGPIPPGCIALVYTGWEFKWSDPEDFLGTKNVSDPSSMHFPSVDSEAGEYLAVKKKIKALGVDTVSIDTAKNAFLKEGTAFPVHYSILGRDLLAFENLNHLHLLPPYGATVAMLPMKLGSGSGGPIRAFAVGWDGLSDPCRLEGTLPQS